MAPILACLDNCLFGFWRQAQRQVDIPILHESMPDGCNDAKVPQDEELRPQNVLSVSEYMSDKIPYHEVAECLRAESAAGVCVESPATITQQP